MDKPVLINLDDISFEDFLKSSFVIQKPFSDTIWIGVGQSQNKFIPFFHTSYYFEEKIDFSPKYIVKTDIYVFREWVKKHKKSNLIIAEIEDFDDEYSQDVNNCIKNIKSDSAIQKLVPVSMAVYKAQNSAHPIENLDKFIKLKGSLYGYWFEGRGMLGVSPEPLFIKDQVKWRSMSLAGTISTSKPDFENTLLNDPKERIEHQLVIDDISNKLLKIADKIDIGETHCFNYGPIAHLRTFIEFEYLNEKDIHNLIESLSPTAALGGFPSESIFDELKKHRYYALEKESRYFGAPITFQYNDECFSIVAIRNIIWNQDKYYIHSGTGIVKDSTVEKEVAEVQNKRKLIRDIFK